MSSGRLWFVGIVAFAFAASAAGCGGGRTPLGADDECAEDDPSCKPGTLKRRDGGVGGQGGKGSGPQSGGGKNSGASQRGGSAGVIVGSSRGGSGGTRTAGTWTSSRGGSGGIRTGGTWTSSRGGSGGIRTGGTWTSSRGGSGGFRSSTTWTGGSGGSSRGGSGGSATICGSIETCDNGRDDDCNGLVDCEDTACQSQPSCFTRKKESCDNGIDDDGNGLVDCKDPACLGDPACFVPGHEICNNNLDDDDDGLVDCADSDCTADPVCVPKQGNEICDNGKDDNDDGLADCTDPQCKEFPACLSSACIVDVDFGSIASSGASVTRTLSTIGATASYSTCAPPGGVARVGSFTLADQADVKLDFTQPSGAAHVVALYRAGVGQACDQNLVDCLRVDDEAASHHTYSRLAAGSYWLIVQSFSNATGATSITLSTGQTSVAEVCNNGKDDDGDGAIDCADLDCRGVSTCPSCVPDMNVGALVLGDRPKTFTVDTSTGSNRYHPSCAGTSTGKDVVVRFTTKAAGGLLVEIVRQSGDHAYGIFTAPAAGQACDQDENGCYYLGGQTSMRTSWLKYTPGEYLLIFKPIAEGKEGQVTVSLSAFADRGVEICDNQIDDDGNNLIDCDDPTCADTVKCQAPMCLADEDLGTIELGVSKTLTVDLTTATRTFSTECSKGNGLGRVYRLHMDRAMGLAISCTQTGQQILQLASHLSPLGPCEGTAPNCQDPATNPFGCNFVMPNVQPGDYNFIVQAFAKGDEGVVNLTLRGGSETVLEICNNGIDDDGDGAVDCSDRKCAGEAACQKAVCKPDKALGILPLEGTITAAALQTAGAGDDQTQVSCVSGQGGGDAVFSFELTSKADLTIEWAQAGNHALAIYKEDDPRLPCDANIPIDCHATAGTITGKYQVTGLVLGKYTLVVDADKAGAEGGVILQITGSPSP